MNGFQRLVIGKQSLHFVFLDFARVGQGQVFFRDHQKRLGSFVAGQFALAVGANDILVDWHLTPGDQDSPKNLIKVVGFQGNTVSRENLRSSHQSFFHFNG